MAKVEMSERAKIRAAKKRAAQRGYALEGEGIKCRLCDHVSHSLVSHIHSAHQMDATQYEEACGLEIGTAILVSPALQAQFKLAGAKGGQKTKEVNAAKAG